ncbi:hypothetical protein [Salipiger thiooxidans]|uniref:hypothetical protein n=1 Tax=Salipiger thiooxidans TaxID=282683 RepID=UPI001CD22214|nr:hypothetical protein [Salipiger thiooxidans]MCA0846127.1 hypothetical protein [Salipiger thiooxidans]
MTGDTFPRSWSGRIIETAKIVGAVSVIASAAVGIWAGTVGPVAEFFDRIDNLIDDVARLQEDVARANGDDRVIRQPAGLSYILEPVTQGDNVVMIMVASRTKLGVDCRLIDWTPIFTDELNTPTPGQRLNAGRMPSQLSDDTTNLRIVMQPPSILRPGRITVYLTLTYQCPTEGGMTTVQDRTDSLPYQLLPAA